MAVLMKAKSLLGRLEYNYSDSAVETIHDKWLDAKINLLEHFRNHPNWNEEQKAIIFSQDFERKINVNGIENFKNWGMNILGKRMRETEAKTYGGRPISFYKRIQYNESFLLNEISEAYSRLDDIFGTKQSLQINGIDAREYLRYLDDEYLRYKKFIEDYEECGYSYYKKETVENYKDFEVIMNAVKNTTSSLVDEELYNVIMNRIDVKIARGMKISKAVQKVCQYYGLDKEVEMRDVTHNGVTRKKDYGYNYQYALFSDSINTVKVTRHTVISLNMIDYWLASHGYKWSSCHNIDKHHILSNNSDYSGCYAGGTESYMLDGSSVVFYTIDKDYDGEDYCLQEKMQRCMFHINNNGSVIVQGRVYPDGRDGGDESYAGQFREVVQKIVSECWNINNQWNLKRGTSNISNYTHSYGVHYRDYQHYNDCTVSLNKEIFEEGDLVEIGHYEIICPGCGCEHEREDNICCDDCWDDFYCHCERCGDGIYEDDDRRIYCDDNGCDYCCRDCAEADGLHECDDGCWHDENHCYQDEWDGDWYAGSPNVETYDGTTYYDEYNAESDGYVYIEAINEWVNENDCKRDSYTDELFYPALQSYIVVDNKYYLNEDNARDDGYVFNEETDEWEAA